MSKEIELLRKIRDQDYLCDSLRAEIDSLLNPPIKSYEDWKPGDLLKVVDGISQTPFEIGEVVIHDDVPGTMAPACRNLEGTVRYYMSAWELEFVERPE